MSFDPSFDHGAMQEPLRHHKQYVKIKDLNRLEFLPDAASVCSTGSCPPEGHAAPLGTTDAARVIQAMSLFVIQANPFVLENIRSKMIMTASGPLTAVFGDTCSGTSGFVQLAYNLLTGEQVAIKFIERGIQMQRIVARELLNHRMCALHPHIVQLKVRVRPADIDIIVISACSCSRCLLHRM